MVGISKNYYQGKKEGKVMTSKGIAAVITVSCFVGNCLAILVRSL